MADEFDVFLSHTSRHDKPVVEVIGRWLGDHGLRVWLDKWALIARFLIRPCLAEHLQASG